MTPLSRAPARPQDDRPTIGRRFLGAVAGQFAEVKLKRPRAPALIACRES
jgi:hypothetical protein